MTKLSFSWIIENTLGGHEAPTSDNDLIYLKELGIQTLVRMVEEHKVRVTPEQITQFGLVDCHVPVWVFTAPTQEQIRQMVAAISTSLTRGKPVGVSCGAGHGRAGTILACYLVKENICTTADDAIREVRLKRAGSIETNNQVEAIREYAQSMERFRNSKT